MKTIIAETELSGADYLRIGAVSGVAVGAFIV